MSVGCSGTPALGSHGRALRRRVQVRSVLGSNSEAGRAHLEAQSTTGRSRQMPAQPSVSAECLFGLSHRVRHTDAATKPGARRYEFATLDPVAYGPYGVPLSAQETASDLWKVLRLQNLVITLSIATEPGARERTGLALEQCPNVCMR